MNFGSFLAVLFFVCLFMSVVGLIFPSTAFFLKNKTRGKAFFSWIGISILVFLLYALIVPSHKNNTENQNQISQTESQPIGATSDNTNSVEDRMKEAIDVAEVSSNPDLGSGKGKIYLVHMKPDNFLGRLSHVGYKISSSLEKWMNQNLITSDDTVVFFMPCELVDNYGKHSVDTVMKITYNGSELIKVNAKGIYPWDMLNLADNVQNFSHIFLGLARSSSPLPEIRPSWETFAHPRSGCLFLFLVTKNSLRS